MGCYLPASALWIIEIFRALLRVVCHCLYGQYLEDFPVSKRLKANNGLLSLSYALTDFFSATAHLYTPRIDYYSQSRIDGSFSKIVIMPFTSTGVPV